MICSGIFSFHRVYDNIVPLSRNPSPTSIIMQFCETVFTKKLRAIFQSILFWMTNITYSEAQIYFYFMFLPFWYTILSYSLVSSVEKRNFLSKGKTILSQAAWFSFRILCRMDLHFKRLIIYQSGSTMNISNTKSVTVLSNLQYNPYIFSVEKKLQK